MASNVQYDGLRITMINDSGADFYPNRVVAFKSAGTGGQAYKFDHPEEDGEGFGVTVIEKKWLDNSDPKTWVIPDDKACTVQLEGVIDVLLEGAVTAGHYVAIASTAGDVKDVGEIDSLSGEAETNMNVFGMALENGEDNGLAAILILRKTVYIPAES